MAAGGVANDRRGASDLIANAIEHAPLDPGHWRGDPRKLRGVDSDAARKVSIKFHLAANFISLKDLLQQSGRNPQITLAIGQNTTAEGEPDIPRSGTCASGAQFVPSKNVYQSCWSFICPWWKTVIPPAQPTAEGEPDIRMVVISKSLDQFVPSKTEKKAVGCHRTLGGRHK